MKLPLIAIVGTTGVGKSNFSIELAKAISGEIINGDSMQVYQGLDQITNKHPMEEREGIPHHLLGHVSWKEEYGVHRFEDEVLTKIREIRARGKVPILVGGTHYYIQSVLFKENIVRIEEKRQLTAEQVEILDSRDRCLSELRKLDPQIAQKFHPNDTRRVRRMLEICFQTGEKPSQVFSQQQKTESRERTLVFWLFSDQQVLNDRLDKRVDVMLSNGLLDEIKDMYGIYKESDIDVERGVWQVIGFKQFLPFLEGQESIENGVQVMKNDTRRYSKQQIGWISKKLLNQIRESNETFCVLDATDLSVWKQTVAHGVEVARDWLEGKEVETKRLVSSDREELTKLVEREKTEFGAPDVEYVQFECPTCVDRDGQHVVSVGREAHEIHLKSRRHVKTLQAIKKREHNMKMKQEAEKRRRVESGGGEMNEES
ncbi:tRNA dimethylallyltransferase [Yarrowia sp. C11]|nr:tRNA dimethylallyltransferase [Yarrowia sp. E02]KAG5367588.1 tRNA dimethylallyltransferase [Yarrowia sp. C11]